ncbi:MAG TPA: CBS domain-containing protein [Vicinamibacterales bacterium]|nr:CBS domain-containing protein [Vicinamibacterales bacterium]
MRLKDIMTTNVRCVRPDQTLARAAAIMQRRGIHHLVVCDGRRIVGVLSESALQTRDAEGVAKVGDAVPRRVILGTPEMTVRQAAHLMRNRADSALPVVSGTRLVGIVTVSDLLAVLERQNGTRERQVEHVR